ncbi:MAG TPA: M23 family metallopeptidase [Terrimesophilobacter sp.]|nr:M23 family metallopeptidase [Terrimesophilobacter sp.]HRQ00822.1 M23 family metallopeptidase [Terrimesophilobacter sp.]
MFDFTGGQPEPSQPRSRRELRELEAALKSGRSRRNQQVVTHVGAPMVEAPRNGSAVRGAKLKSKQLRESRRSVAKQALNSSPSIAAAKPPRRRSMRRAIASNLMSLGAMAGVGLMFVATTVPANAFYEESVTDAPLAAVAEVQALSVADNTISPTVSRDDYGAISLEAQMRALYGARSWAYSTNPSGTIQWPFPIPVPITSGFGPRAACGFCSSMHLGLDFTPGAGYPIHAIAAGTVIAVNTYRWGLGNHVIVRHNINGQTVDSVYAHMQNASINVAVGQEIPVAYIIGQVGSTGASTGAHLHLEIHVNGVAIDPFDWLQANAD